MSKEEKHSFIKDFFNKADIGVSEVFFDEGDEAFLYVSLKTDNPKRLIGHSGETLSSINYLVSKLLEKKFMANPENAAIERVPGPEIIIDVDNFRRRRIENLRTTAHMMAERAKYFKSDIDVDPMPAYDRKIMHTYLQNSKNIKTESVGMGKDRHLVIKYIEEISM